MSETPTITVKTCALAGLSPLGAYARLTSYTPGRGSFLFESLDVAGGGGAGGAGGAGAAGDGAGGGGAAAGAGRGGAHGRFSVVGYRVRTGSMMPPGVDAIAVLAAEVKAEAEAESFAHALALGRAGFFSSSVPSLWSRVRLHDDEGASGMFNDGATVVVFDHAEDTVTVAGPSQGRVVERCLWELEHGPDPKAIGEVPPDLRPATLGVEPTDEKLSARASRARAYFGDIESVTLAQTFTSPVRDAEPFDCYRALRELGGGAHGYFIDFGETPTHPRTVITGTSDVVLYQRRHGHVGPDLEATLRATLPWAATVGTPVADAARLVRQLEDSSRQTWGGSVGFYAPGGVGTYVLADQSIVMQDGIFWCTGGARLDRTSEPASASERAGHDAARRLAAIAYAQQISR